MQFKPIFCLCVVLLFAFQAISQSDNDAPQSRLLRFDEIGNSDANRAVLNVLVTDQESGEPILGATTLLVRQNPEQVHGKVSQWDGRCKFKVAPGTYHLKVQLTGMVTFEMEDISLGAGGQYELSLEMARLSQPVPSVKQQAGNN